MLNNGFLLFYFFPLPSYMHNCLPLSAPYSSRTQPYLKPEFGPWHYIQLLISHSSPLDPVGTEWAKVSSPHLIYLLHSLVHRAQSFNPCYQWTSIVNFLYVALARSYCIHSCHILLNETKEQDISKTNYAVTSNLLEMFCNRNRPNYRWESKWTRLSMVKKLHPKRFF